MTPRPPSREQATLWQHIQPLIALNDHKRPWGGHLTVALSVGIPLLVGVWLNQFILGIVVSLGGLSSIYLRQTPLAHRMVTMALVGFGFCVSFTVSSLAGFHPLMVTLAIGLVAFSATFVSRYFTMPPPGSFFFIMVACVASAMPYDLAALPQRIGLIFFGCMLASTLVLGYSWVQFMTNSTKGIHPGEPTEPRVVAIFLEAGTIAFFIAASYLLAIGLGFDRPYWAPISCLAVIQGASFRAVWHRNIHRIVGTALGLCLAWLIFSLEPNLWALALVVMSLSFTAEVLITRNYGFAVVFVTPLSIIFAEASQAVHDINNVIYLRMVDVILGSMVGYFGGWVLHKKQYYARLEQAIMARLKKT